MPSKENFERHAGSLHRAAPLPSRQKEQKQKDLVALEESGTPGGGTRDHISPADVLLKRGKKDRLDDDGWKGQKET